ncbi:MAG: 2-dehydropantoate 2-reductase [Saccharofermentans sp.]|nr:2-dehydropantoate 2-reductase [Saccharofermentans sp.]
MEYKSVAILGAGAVGCYVLWGLSHKDDVDLCIVADGERKDRLSSSGFVINGEKYTPIIKTPSEAHGADLLIVCTKYTALEESLEDIKEITDNHTVVMSLLNGVDSEEVIARVIPEGQIVHSLIKVASERRGNEVKFDPETTIGIIYGEKDMSRSQERIQALDNLFSNTGIHYRSTDVILSEIWSKFRLNVANNQPQAMISCGVGAYQDSEHVAFIQGKLRDEVDAVAKAKGVDISLADASSFRGSKVQKRARYSTLQDLDNKRHTEVDVFAGSMVKMGKELGVPTPYNEFTYHMIKALEEKNDGLFDYE